MKTLICSLERLTDEELIARVKSAVARDRESTATVIAHLAELDKRRLYLPQACSSMFIYCTRVLKFSERAAYARIEAARAARKFPVILDRLVDGSINLTTITVLKAHLTAENHLELLEKAAGRTRLQVEELVAAISPRPPVAASLRKLPDRHKSEHHPAACAGTRPGAGIPIPSTPIPLACLPASQPGETEHTAPSLPQPELSNDRPPASHRPLIVPLAPEYYRLQVTLRSETHALLRQAQELMRHQIPDGDPSEILDRALKDLVEKLCRRKFAALTGMGRIK